MRNIKLIVISLWESLDNEDEHVQTEYKDNTSAGSESD